MDLNALLAQGKKWKTGDSGVHANGDLAVALKMITAKTYVIAFEGDMFVSVSDCEFEQKLINNSELKVIPLLMGYFSMLGLLPADFDVIDSLFSQLLHFDTQNYLLKAVSLKSK